MNDNETTDAVNQNSASLAAQPQPVIPQTPPQNEPEKIASPSAGLIILQWLTYAFWGWTLLALSTLTYIVIFNLFERSDMGEGMLPYALAATFVLLFISLLCDFFYRRHEAIKKTGASMIVMVIHAVIFALFGIGALIGAVFAFIQLIIATDSYSGGMASLISLLIITFLYSIAFLRTLNPMPRFKIARWFSVIMLVVAGTFVVLSVVGPLAQAQASKDDRRLENNLSSVSEAVNNYALENKKLPTQLSETQLQPEARQIIDDGLVEYKIDSKILYHYQLCVTYKQKHGETYDLSRSNLSDDGYDTYLSNYNHPAGNVCYKLKPSISDSSY